MEQDNCAYCAGGTLVAKFGIKVRELPASKVYLFREQSHRGRCIVASKRHVSEMIDLSDRERRAFLDDVARVAAAIRKIFRPAKINYGAYGDTGCHLHFHLVPKYEDGFEWGGTFAMNPDRVYLSDEEYADLVARLSAELMFSASGARDVRQALERLRDEIVADGRIDYDETTVLLAALEPLADDRRVADLVAALKGVRDDGIVEDGESARLRGLLDGLLS